jgi:pantoate--beta-alanine ligase
MGALHAGHISLVDASRGECDYTVVTIFVNATQFGPGEDYHRYPRTLEADLQALEAAQADLVFAPPHEEIYPAGFSSFVDVGSVSEPFEGRHRPGHFRGVATVVLKLLNLAAADVAFFGQKDYQQSLVVRRLAVDFNVPTAIRVCPTVREPDGLALSSRNVYLSADERRRSLVLSQSLNLAAELVAGGTRDTATVLARMRQQIESAGDVRIDYVAIADRETLAELTTVDRPAVALIAARVGTTRLIDNRFIE